MPCWGLVDGEAGWWVGALGSAAAVLTAAISGLILWQKARRETRAADRKDTLDEWRDFVERQNAVIKQLQVAVETTVKENATLREDNAALREDNAEQRAAIHFLYGQLKRAFQLLHEQCKIDPGPMPDLPPLRVRQVPDANADFVARQAAQSADLVRQAGEVARVPLPPSGEQPP